MAILTLVFGRDCLGTFDVNGHRMIVGRADDCDIVIDNLGVSRHHAIIEKWEGGFCINDLDSNNGTFVNGRRIAQPTALNFGDQIGIGKHVLIFDTHARKLQAAVTAPHGEALPDMDWPGRGTMLVEPEKMEKIQKKVTAARKAHLLQKMTDGRKELVVALDQLEMVFGKASACDVQIKGMFCARKHAVIKHVDQGYHLVNLAILVPTRVNGMRVESTFLCGGDEIKMGKNSFVFHSSQ